MSFYEYRCEDRLYLKSNIFPSEVIHGFTAKLGGVSHGNINGLNLGFRVNDDIDAVMENYRFVAADLGFELENAVLSKQTHTDNIRIVTDNDRGKGIVRKSDIEDTDGLVTNIKEIALVVFSADCTPILLYDKKRKVAAAVHSGWRGTVKGIAPKCVALMNKHFGSDPTDIVAAAGPSIGPCCFEIGADIVGEFEEKYVTPKNNGKYMVDLWVKNRDMLMASGLRAENIDFCNICTVCESDKYYSYRTHRDKTGRQAAIIAING